MNEQEKRYDALQAMFNSEGWEEYTTYIEDELTRAVDTAAFQCPTNESWQMRRGMIDTLTKLRGYQNWIEVQRDVAENGEGNYATL